MARPLTFVPRHLQLGPDRCHHVRPTSRRSKSGAVPTCRDVFREKDGERKAGSLRAQCNQMPRQIVAQISPKVAQNGAKSVFS